MDRGTYSAASAGFSSLRRLEVVANNLANINTPGFKAQRLVRSQQQFEDTLASAINDIMPYARGDQQRTPGTVDVRTVTDFTQGPIKNTNNPLDVALTNPNDFFIALHPDTGEQFYTRAGNFTLNDQGQIVSMEGFPIRGDGGAITAQGGGIEIQSDGTIFSGGNRVGRLGVVRFNSTEGLERVAATRFKLASADAPTPVNVQARIEPRSLEMANVTAIESMVTMIAAHRAFEAYTKSAQSIDSLNQSAINQIGKNR